jgi:hypothetical protein
MTDCPQNPACPSVSLEKHFEDRICALEKSMDIARANLERRLDAMNEIRGAMRDQAAIMITRQEYILAHQVVLEKIESLQLSRAELSGKASITAFYLSIGLSMLGVIVAIIAIFHH